MPSSRTRKTLTVGVLIIYFLTPYSMVRMRSGCSCGCGQYICHCCRSGEHFVDMTPVVECSENTSDESYEQSPAQAVPLFQLAVILGPLGMASLAGGDSALAGYRDPPLKPPRSA